LANEVEDICGAENDFALIEWRPGFHNWFSAIDFESGRKCFNTKRA
jgi:hypothetical protein